MCASKYFTGHHSSLHRVKYWHEQCFPAIINSITILPFNQRSTFVVAQVSFFQKLRFLYHNVPQPEYGTLTLRRSGDEQRNHIPNFRTVNPARISPTSELRNKITIPNLVAVGC